ncbi:MAG: PLP-dependent aminotransferase family protein [Proteobacteria bacterium]|nr:PLP-dependent aminotransferase family protein [Pseudomonadota bacterium]
MPARTTKLYEDLTDQVTALIRAGTLRCGDRAPSVRQLARERGASAGTVVHAYELLQARGYLRPRSRSGFYVSDAWRTTDQHQHTSRPSRRPTRLDVSELVFEVLEAMRSPDLAPFGSAFPGPDLFPLRQLAQLIGASTRRLSERSTLDDLPPGNEKLRRQIARRYLASGAQVAVEEIVVTSGALEALNLCLQVVTEPGDIVLIESPSFYGCLQAIESLGRRALEVPTHPGTGIDVDEVEQLLSRHRVRACWFMTAFQNPLGATMPAAARERLVRLLSRRGVPLIEDSVYADLYFGAQRPHSAKSFDTEGLVLDCGSFAKNLAPGYRLGWVAAGRFAQAVTRRKSMSSVGTAIPIQAVIGDYLGRGTFERHLRRLRRALQERQSHFLAAMERYMPAAMKWNRPSGGYLLWAELPPHIDAIRLHREALAEGISLAPGPIFSASHAFHHAIRLNYGHPWTAKTEAALKRLGNLIARTSASR